MRTRLRGTGASASNMLVSPTHEGDVTIRATDASTLYADFLHDALGEPVAPPKHHPSSMAPCASWRRKKGTRSAAAGGAGGAAAGASTSSTSVYSQSVAKVGVAATSAPAADKVVSFNAEVEGQ